MFPNNRVLASMRRTALKFLTSRCDILRLQSSTSPYLTEVTSWQVVSSDIACAVRPLRKTDEEGMHGSRPANEDFYLISLPHTAQVEGNDRIRVSGKLYDIRQRQEQVSNLVTVEIEVVLVGGGADDE